MNTFQVKEWIELIRELNQIGIVTGSDVANILTKIGENKTLRYLITKLLLSRSDINRIASKSFTHPNGFDRIELISFGLPTKRLRLHIWWPNNDPMVHIDIHDHPWSFQSIILTGRHKATVFREDIKGRDHFSFLCKNVPRGTSNRLEFKEKTRLSCIYEHIFKPGDTYSLNYDQPHRITPHENIITSTLVIQGPYVRRQTHIYSKRLFEETSLTKRPIQPFKAEELIEKLETFSDFLNRSN